MKNFVESERKEEKNKKIKKVYNIFFYDII